MGAVMLKVSYRILDPEKNKDLIRIPPLTDNRSLILASWGGLDLAVIGPVKDSAVTAGTVVAHLR